MSKKSLEEKLEEKGYVSMRSKVYVTDTNTGGKETYDWDRRLVSPDGRTMYRPGTGVITSFPQNKQVVYDD